MTFFHWIRGGVIQVSEIAEAVDDDAAGEIIITTRDGKRRRGAGSVDTLMSRAVQIIPAEPGWNLIVAWRENDLAKAIRTPLIAWALCADGGIRPVTPQGVGDGDSRNPWERFGHYAETPNGRIVAAEPDLDPWTFPGVGELAAARSAWEKGREAKDKSDV